MAYAEWPIALRSVSSASTIGAGPQREITLAPPNAWVDWSIMSVIINQ